MTNSITINNTDAYESRIIEGQIAYWKFKSAASVQTFMDAFMEFQEMIAKPSINSLLVNVEMENAWGKEIQEIWLKTGDVLEEQNILKWAVVSSETSKELTIKYLVKGGKEGKRKYDSFVTPNEDKAIGWLLS